MPDQTLQMTAIGIYFVAMLVIGFHAYRQTTDLGDYMLAGRRLKPVVAGLSAGATDMSGWLLMGLPGAIYTAGLAEAWIAIGLTVGAYLNWRLVAPRLRSYTEVSNNSITLPSFLENRFKDRTRLLRIVSGIIILVFFTFYISSGMVAGGVFFQSAFGIPYFYGMLLVAGVTLVYTLFGGFLGSSLTDVVQGLLMLAALVAVPVATVVALGGLGETVAAIQGADAAYNAVAPGTGLDRLSLLAGGSLLAILSAAAWGLGYFGQPHIIVRFMAMRSPADARTGRRICIGWMVLITGGAVLTGLVGAGYFHASPVALENPETVFLALSGIFFQPFPAGLVLAAVLAAIMSTISSQLIVCSSALVEDLYKISGRHLSAQRQVFLGRAGVLAVAFVAGALAVDPGRSILELVGFAWAGFGAAFGPVILLSLFWRRITASGALAGMIAGAGVVVVWGNVAVLKGWMYEIVPGFLACTLMAIAVSLTLGRHSDERIQAEFSEMQARL